MNNEKSAGTYNPDVELAKGAELTAGSYDKTQSVAITAGKVTVGGKAGVAQLVGLATGSPAGGGIDGTINLWLSIFRFMRPDGTVNHVAGWNIALALKPGQTPQATAKAFEDYINGGTRPYRAKATGAMLEIVYAENEKP